MKAMLLAAGRGSRLRPLTNTIPKPLVKVGEFRLIEHAIIKLKNVGIQEIVINVAYFADKIMHFLGNGSRYGVTLEYSYEGDESFGTGGGVYRALQLLGDKPFWLMSADVYSNFLAFDRCLQDDFYAHLVMVPNPDFHPNGDYGLTGSGLLTHAAPKLTYGNIALVDGKLFSDCIGNKFSLSPVFNKAISQQAITGEIFAGDWFNVGTVVELERLRKYMLRQ